jgi:succinoglycan biosynthesis transport protein ExoP
MLQVDNKPVAPAGTTDIASLADTFAGFSAFVRRHLFIILVVFATTLGLGFVYLFTTPPSFTAQAMLLIDTRRVQLFQQQSVLGDVAIDSATVESQVEILKSEGIALAVIKELHLNEEPEFVGSGAGLIGALFNSISTLFSSPAPKSEYENLRRAVSVFRGNLLIKRVGPPT